MKRFIKPHILKDLPDKIVLITGPRQCGKTTLSKQLTDSYDYFNYDAAEDRLALEKKTWDRQKKLIIFDELHKMQQWKRWLKGVFDTEAIPPQYLVTGSAMLDSYRKVGDSLAGRYFQYRLHPLDLKEIAAYHSKITTEIFNQFWQCSGFPEPFLKGEASYYQRWQRSHLDIILRQDLLDMYAIRDIQAIENLVLLLKERTASTISYSNLARDLQRDATTVKRWLELLENLYIIFRVTPYHNNIPRSLLKEPKYYFYDHGYTNDTPGQRLENIVASALLKELHFIEDTTGKKTALHFLRTKDGVEIDFLVIIDGKPTHLIEVKSSDNTPSKAFHHFRPLFPKAKAIQLVHQLPREKTYPDGLEIRDLALWLGKLEL